MDTKEMVEKRKIELIDLLNDQSIFVVQFTADTDDKYYEVEFRRIELNIPSSFSSYMASKCDRNNYIIHIKNDNDNFVITQFTIDMLIDSIINPSNFVDIKFIRKGEDELSYRKSVINAIANNKNKEVEIQIKSYVTFKVFKFNGCWKADYQGLIIDVLPWAIAQEIMNFYNDIWLIKCL